MEAGSPGGGFRPSLRAKYEFGWDILEVIVGGKSTIDAPGGFLTSSAAEADRFVRAYGYDLDNPIDGAELLGNFQEALNFIRRHFLKPDNPEGLALEIPRKLVEMTDVRELFVQASVPEQGVMRSWACAVLKVMHTIAHLDKDVRSPYFADVQKQIFDRYYRLIQRDDGEGQLYLGERADDPLRVDLAAFQTKPMKSRDSTLLKMLHKPENVAEDIFDRVGIRFVTRTRLDSLRVIKFLKERMVLVAPNIKPSRSRNTLVNAEILRAQITGELDAFERGDMDEAQLTARLEAAAVAQTGGEAINPHSSQFYRAIQFTARQLVKFRNPLYDELKDLRNLVRTQGPQDPESDLRRAAEKIDLKYMQREVRFFYPYEVQLMDEQSFEENERGRSAHSEYKKAQVQTALRRVMGSLI